jgi:hypothetical protein
MSHFTVLVIGEDVEKLLAPYDENLEVEPYKNYLSDRDIERIVGHYAKANRTVSKDNLQSLLPFMKDWCNEEGYIDAEGLYAWSTSNKKHRWDWYEIGGRWQGSLRLKPGGEGKSGSASSLIENHIYRPEYVDQARFKHIDWSYMRNEPEALLNLKLQWKNDQEYHRKLYSTEEGYIRQNMTFRTYAVLTEDGIWHAVGEMGWFGASSESADEEKKWVENFWETFLEGLDGDTLLTFVDCHI